MKGTLELLGMTFHAFHGCYDFEREKGTQYIVDFSAEVELDRVQIGRASCRERV